VKKKPLKVEVADTRRAAPRFELKFVIPFRLQERPDELLAGHVLNLGAGGLLFETEKPLPLHTALYLFFDNLPGARQSIRVSASVTRSEIDEETDRYLIVALFSALADDARALINQSLLTTDIFGMLQDAARQGASDLHLSADHPPLVRMSGELRPLREAPISGLDVRDMVYTLLDQHHRQAFDRDLELDFSLSVSATVRFRVNVHSQRGNVEASFRRIEPAVRTFEELHLPDMLRQLAERRDGLVLITGPTGSGKTTAAAAMIEHINRTRTAVIITMENPIEYVYTYQRSVIKQREIGVDTFSYPVALKEAMRQDPDVIFIGEVRDEETMRAAMDAAQTGHLVIATFSAASCIQSIHRIYQFFTKTQQRELQTELAACLRGIVCLRLLSRLDGAGMIPAAEILVGTPAIANLLRKGAVEQITSAIQTGGSLGMQSFSASLDRLVKTGAVGSQAAQLALNGSEA